MTSLKDRLQALPASVLKGMRRGIEKESLRCRADGALAPRRTRRRWARR